MKNFMIFAIICSIGVMTTLARPNTKDIEAKWEQAVIECARELNATLEHLYHENSLYSEDNVTCITTCAMRKSVAVDLIASNNKTTVYNGMIRMINQVYEVGFENSESFREELIDTMDNCNITEKTECDFVKCVLHGSEFRKIDDYFNPPVFRLN